MTPVVPIRVRKTISRGTVNALPAVPENRKFPKTLTLPSLRDTIAVFYETFTQSGRQHLVRVRHSYHLVWKPEVSLRRMSTSLFSIYLKVLKNLQKEDPTSWICTILRNFCIRCFTSIERLANLLPTFD